MEDQHVVRLQRGDEFCVLRVRNMSGGSPAPLPGAFNDGAQVGDAVASRGLAKSLRHVHDDSGRTFGCNADLVDEPLAAGFDIGRGQALPQGQALERMLEGGDFQAPEKPIQMGLPRLPELLAPAADAE